MNAILHVVFCRGSTGNSIRLTARGVGKISYSVVCWRKPSDFTITELSGEGDALTLTALKVSLSKGKLPNKSTAEHSRCKSGVLQSLFSHRIKGYYAPRPHILFAWVASPCLAREGDIEPTLPRDDSIATILCSANMSNVKYSAIGELIILTLIQVCATSGIGLA